LKKIDNYCIGDNLPYDLERYFFIKHYDNYLLCEFFFEFLFFIENNTNYFKKKYQLFFNYFSKT